MYKKLSDESKEDDILYTVGYDAEGSIEIYAKSKEEALKIFKNTIEGFVKDTEKLEWIQAVNISTTNVEIQDEEK
jgi:hypothetical protein